MADASEVAVPLSALGTAIAAVYRAGSLASDVKQHTGRIDKLEAAQAANVTRGELDARFAALDEKIDLVIAMLKQTHRS